ncbi:hypothetical protein HF086_018325 [Spodoptera exigua]|uniref:DUF5641 domain-containing protein n=1 Tax=Spodoptera exigua TaxID=7107 RepID=A0A922M0I2_SPOEX|nr:hypothetical protein HF086_018325 [Spodoptera exigua]
MVLTRSQSGDSRREQTQEEPSVTAGPGASSSAPESSSVGVSGTGSGSTTTTNTDTTRTHGTLKPVETRSHRSTSSKKKRLAELEARERLAEMKVKQAQAERELQEIQLQRIRTEAESSEDEDLEDDLASVRIGTWLARPAPPPGGETRPPPHDASDGKNGRDAATDTGGAATGARPLRDGDGYGESVCAKSKGNLASEVLRGSDKVIDVGTLAAALAQVARSSREPASKKSEDIPVLKLLSMFMNEEADKCGAYAQPERGNDESSDVRQRRRVERTFNVNKETPNDQCPACKQHGHKLPDCSKYKQLDIDTRWDIAKNSNMCFRCLRNRHRRFTCKAPICDVKECNMKHHKLLHKERKVEASHKVATPPAASPTPAVITHETVTSARENVSTTTPRNRRAYLKIVPVTLSGPHTSVDTYALLDDGSTVTLLDASVADILGADGPASPMWIQGIGTELKHEQSRTVSLHIRDVFWRRWVREYLPLLQNRREPYGSGTPPKVGDVVVICDSNLPRNTWPKGRVTQVLPGADGEIRVVDVMTRGLVLRRPTKRIVVLPTESPEGDGGRSVHDRIIT